MYDLIVEAEAAAAAAAPRGTKPADTEVADSVDLFGATIILKVAGLDRARPVSEQVDRLPPHLFAGAAAEGEEERSGAAPASSSSAAAAAAAPGATPDAKSSRSCITNALIGFDEVFQRRSCGLGGDERLATERGAAGAAVSDDDASGGGGAISGGSAVAEGAIQASAAAAGIAAVAAACVDEPPLRSKRKRSA